MQKKTKILEAIMGLLERSEERVLVVVYNILLAAAERGKT